MSALTWTPEQDAQVRALWRKGLTASKVGLEMGVSRNAIIGRLHRLGEPKRDNRIKIFIAPRPAIAPTPLDHNPHKSCNVGFLDVRFDQCREVVGHDGLAIFCGEIIVDGSSYCQHHHTINYLPARARKAAA
jgi:GcrA cell cycle regulator